MNSHSRFIKLGLDTNPMVATRLLNAYASCQSANALSHAHQLFDQVPSKDIVLWTSIISAYTRAGNPHKALQLFSQMNLQFPPIQSNPFVYSIVARACGSFAGHYLQLGKCVHTHVIKSGFLPNVVVETAFLDMYAKCGDIEFSHKVFDEMPQRNSISWNAMIAGYVQNGMEALGLHLFYRMKCLDCQIPDEFAVSTVLAACAGINDMDFGMQVHGYLLTVGFESECAYTLCNMYFRCGEMSCSEKALSEIKENVISRLMMIKGYVFNGRYYDAIMHVVQDSNFIEIATMDHSVVVSILTACANLSLRRVGKQVHCLIITFIGSHLNWVSDEKDLSIVGSALIDMYCKCSSVREARQAFDWFHPAQHISHWNAMITGYIHAGLLEDARKCFGEMPKRDLISWTTMISGYVQHGLPQQGLTLLTKMYNNEDGLMMEGNCFTFSTALEACTLLSALGAGKQIHVKLIRSGVNIDINNVVVGTALINMYSKSGSLNYAQKVFDRLLEKNVIAWTSMITGYAIHGIGSQALELFQQMLEIGVKPNEVTFISVLTACSHCGFVEEGIGYFKLMKDKYGILPRADHYTCVIDLLGRAGRLTEAWSLLEEIGNGDINDDSGETIWGAFLGACRLHGDLEMGSRAAQKMLKKKQQVSSTYITLSNVYAAAGLWDEAFKVREKWRREGTIPGDPGGSQIHVQLGAA
ncbi:pentatricopeptide repeat-containing protein At2g13600-like [Macadamia integrifolia]|uniref:pentatricopeptide repeat-containing protein At2g13600-like n=1 Tax=Macadamia integrifolia TaxID=60698 RepID=UPI001C52D023|nr:pentatricopeptide repeat-containing protein At2g13600-like [Macadamia integrifolia]XP_042478051.1 pentatricopeptide repeat-containing protein At2g13600-like [Macadamia integrifolia]XP_042478052.1 pentatricopeptide repeat-containing protein At2g13600-like [Macadamia integrifolia]XP_042478053.1 pentatricopeptide repeat-containing protein At2g13600-like [Macadamia integrifolia]XP_042478054.1 pentatricopeptide repeat-containing protein At2g13600-like [Macadamia integrifolia]XP_042478056.1 penta